MQGTEPALKILIYEKKEDCIVNNEDNISTIVDYDSSNTLEKSERLSSRGSKENLNAPAYNNNNSTELNEVDWMKPVKHIQVDECAQENEEFYKPINVPEDGDCLFNSLIYLLKSRLSVKEFKEKLLNSPQFVYCEFPENTKHILETNKAWGDSDVIFLFASEYNKNVCVHLHSSQPDEHGNDRVTYAHFKESPSN